MKNYRLVVLLGAGLLTFASTGIARDKGKSADKPKRTDKSLIVNGGFEELNARGGPANWSNKQHAGVRAYEFRVVDDHTHGGKRSFMIHRVKQQVWGQTDQRVAVTPDMVGKTVELGIWTRHEKVGGQGLRISLGAFAQSTLLQHVTSDRIVGDGDWTRHTLRLEIPEDTTQISVAVTLDDEGTLWIDDAELRVLDKP